VTKRLVAAILVLLLVGAVGVIAGCGGVLPKDAMAKVGQTYITQAQFDARVADFEAQYAGQTPDPATDPEGYTQFQRDVLDYMVMYQLAVQKAPSFNVSVTDAEVQTEIDNILNTSFGGDQTQFDAALKAQNMTLDQLKLNYKESMLLQKVYDAVTKDITTVPDADIAAYYDAHKSDYFTDETRTARHILIAPKSSASDTSTTAGSSTTTTAAPTEADWAAALATAQKVRADLVGGADWTTEAAQYSDDTGTKDSGGDLGTITKGEMVAEFETAVFSLKLNEISQPVKTIYGYHIIQVTGITPAKQGTLDDVKADINTTLVNDKKGVAWEDWIAKTKTEVGVIYKAGMEPTTTTTAATTATTSAAGATTTSAGGASTTTTPATESTTSTVAPATTTTAVP
jgi:parvulin-like peptidyl-prolyl isomerase